MVMKAKKVERDVSELTPQHIDDIHDFLRAGFTVPRVAEFFRCDPKQLQARLQRQRGLFDEVPE